MKKPVIYLSLFVLVILFQSCNSNTATDKSKTTDSSSATSSTMNDTSVNQTNSGENDEDETDTSTKKSAMHVNASEVPSSVITAFNNKYQNVSDVKWFKGDNKKGKTFYKARWQANDRKMMAMFGDDGSFIKEKELN